ncbi:MAG: CorA family divalent cation transporter [Clostridia bacterium]
MFLKIEDGEMRECALSEACIAVINESDAENARTALPFLNKKEFAIKFIKYTKIEAHTEHLSGTIAVPKKETTEIDYSRLAFFIDGEHFIIFGKSADDCAFANNILSTCAIGHPDLAIVICSFFEGMIARDYNYLDELENKITIMEDDLLDGTLSDYDRRIIKLRKRLLYMHSFYNGMVKIGEELQEDRNAYFSTADERRFELMTQQIERLEGHIHMLLDYSMQVIELHHTQVELKQNKIMQVLTVVTAIFMPLTLIAGWYGMNFVSMGELKWEHGYTAVIALSVIVCAVTTIVFKRKKFF